MNATQEELWAFQRLIAFQNRAGTPGCPGAGADATASRGAAVQTSEVKLAQPTTGPPGLQFSQYWGAYLHQLQLLSQHADHPSPSASSTESGAMLASLLANNPGLLQAMSSPPPAGAVVVPSPSLKASTEAPGVEASPAAPGRKNLADGGGSSDDTTVPAGPTGASPQFPVPGNSNHPYKPVPSVPLPPTSIAQAPTRPSVSTTALGVVGSGGNFASAAIAAQRAPPLISQGSAEPSTGALGVTNAPSESWAGFKRSLLGDAKEGQGPLATVLPRKKRSNTTAPPAVGAHNAEHVAYSSLLRMRSLGESSALSLGADYSLDPGGGGSAGGGSTEEDGLALAGGGKCSKEKNREAQRRFRERQKSLIGDLRETVNVLTREGQAQSKRIFGLQEENRLLKMLLNTARNGAPDSDAVGGNNL